MTHPLYVYRVQVHTFSCVTVWGGRGLSVFVKRLVLARLFVDVDVNLFHFLTGLVDVCVCLCIHWLIVCGRVFV